MEIASCYKCTRDFLKGLKIGVWRLCGYVYFQFAILEKPKVVFVTVWKSTKLT